jgi:hypothetical protein
MNTTLPDMQSVFGSIREGGDEREMDKVLQFPSRAQKPSASAPKPGHGGRGSGGSETFESDLRRALAEHPSVGCYSRPLYALAKDLDKTWKANDWEEYEDPELRRQIELSIESLVKCIDRLDAGPMRSPRDPWGEDD